MSQENVELAKILLPQPGTDYVPLIRDEGTYARLPKRLGDLDVQRGKAGTLGRLRRTRRSPRSRGAVGARRSRRLLILRDTALTVTLPFTDPGEALSGSG